MSEFDKIRKSQETRNETIVNYFQLLHYLCVAIANISTHVWELVPFKSSGILISILSCASIVRILLFFYFKGSPKYYNSRKYLITGFDLVLSTILPLILANNGLFSWVFINLLVVSIFSMNIVLSSLRYSIKLVVFNGTLFLIIFISLFSFKVTNELFLPILFSGSLILFITTLCMAYVVSSLIKIHKEAAIKEQLARFLPTELVEQISQDPTILQKKTQRMSATVLFTDIRGFTRLSERLPPEKVVEFLNEFLEEMTISVMNNKGMLDKYIGDAVLAVFGVPVIYHNHALKAYEASCEMRERLKSLNTKLIKRGLPELSMGIGLHTGDLLIGSIGSSRRLDYTVIGDTVNVASRLEGMTRSYPVEILLSNSTKEAIGNTIEFHEIATVNVKNREEPLTLWSPDRPS